MAYRSEAEVQAILDAASYNHRDTYYSGWDLDYQGKYFYLGNSCGWEYDEMKIISDIFYTDKIDVVGVGCDTCGFGASICVNNEIPG